jgi:hypothetical protein
MFRPLSRRTFLRGAGVSIALPFLEAMLPVRAGAQSAARGRPPRMAFVYIPNGVNIADWRPRGEGRNWQFGPTMEPLQPLKDDLCVISGLGHPRSSGQHDGADTWLTGADLKGTPGYDYKNSVSVDQVAAESHGLETRIASLQLSFANGTGPPMHTATLSFNRDGTALPAQNNPEELFNRLFHAETGGSRTAKKQRFDEDRSILDAVLDDANLLNRRLGVRDQRKLDEYLTSVREVERRVQTNRSWLDKPRPPVESRGLALDARFGDHHMQPWFRTMYDLIALAFQTDTTRIATFETGAEAGGGRLEELGTGVQHEYSHHGGDPNMLKTLARIDRYHIENFAYFLDRLKSTQDGDAPLLDRTMILFGSGMNNGETGTHSPKDVPLIFAGGKALSLETGHHLRFDVDSTPQSNLLLSMLNRMDEKRTSFSDSTGLLSGLTR